jgi:hypothetical protein
LPPIIRIAFGQFAGWEALIRPNLDAAFEASFVDLAGASLEAFDAVVPLATAHYAPLRMRPEMLGRRFFHPRADVAALCDDKLRLAEWLLAEGFSDHTPPLRSPGAPYPYVWKRRWGAWGNACWFVAGPDAERELDPADEAWFAQAWTPGAVEYATHVLRVAGRVRYASTFTYDMGAEGLVRGQQHTPQHTGFSPGCPHMALFETILTRLSYEGTACFNYKLVDGRPMIFEINPRFGGSLAGDITAYLQAYLAALSRD